MFANVGFFPQIWLRGWAQPVQAAARAEVPQKNVENEVVGYAQDRGPQFRGS